MKRMGELVLLIATTLFVGAGCGSGGNGGSGVVNDAASNFLLQPWIWEESTGFAVRTYDIGRQSVGSVNQVSMINWQRIGTLGWQSNQRLSGTLTTREQGFEIVYLSGLRESYSIVDQGVYFMVLSNSSGTDVIWYNCDAAGWPELIRATICRA